MEAEVLMLQYAGWTVAVGLDEVRSRLQDLRNRSEASVFIVRVFQEMAGFFRNSFLTISAAN